MAGGSSGTRRRRHHAGLPDLSTLRRNTRDETRMITVTHRACQAIAAPCGHNSGACAARASIANGELHGKIIAPIATGLPESPTTVEAKATTASCPIVTGIDIVWT